MDRLRRLYSQIRPPPSLGFRTVEVESRSSSDEFTWVFLTAAFIVLVVVYIVAFEHYGWNDSERSRDNQASLLPFQRLFRDLPSAEQRILREMREGFVEAARVRSNEGAWPAAQALAREGIPPFVVDPIEPTGLSWSKQRDGLLCNYLGVPVAPDEAPSYLIMIQEPDPITGEKAPPPSVVDEEHQLLADGTLLHVTYWVRAGSDGQRGVRKDPARLGWQQIRMKTLFEEMEKQW